MNDWTRLLLYGTYDGFSRSTFGDDNIQLILDNGERVEVPNHFVKNANDFVEKNKIKLKDIIARMEGLNGLTRLEWLDDILYKFGSSYGASKYRAGYKQGKLEGEWVGQQLKDADKIRQELNKPVVPQFVADWYEEHKDDFEIALFRCIDHIPSVYDEGDLNEFEEWIIDGETKPFQTLVNMHQFGYEVEKEKRYSVKIKGEIEENLLVYGLGINRYFFARIYDSSKRNEHTRKELEEAGFGEVFDSPLFEVEEVE